MKNWSLIENDDIETPENIINFLNEITKIYSDYEEKEGAKEYQEVSEKILNLIEKQSKEIEELKEDLTKKPMFLIKDIYSPKLKEINLQDIEGLIEQGREEVKDKIKAKIEEVDKDENASIPDFIEYAKEYATQKLQSLLEKE